MPIKKIISTLEAIDLDEILRRIISRDDIQELIIQLNTEGQRTSQLFEQGVDARGVTLKQIGGSPFTASGYSPVTIGIKQEKGQRVDHITLKDTGVFYRSFNVLVHNNFFEIQADGQKADVNLLDEWGENILGLTEQNTDILREKIIQVLPEIVEQIIADLG